MLRLANSWLLTLFYVSCVFFPVCSPLPTGWLAGQLANRLAGRWLGDVAAATVAGATAAASVICGIIASEREDAPNAR